MKPSAKKYSFFNSYKFTKLDRVDPPQIATPLCPKKMTFEMWKGHVICEMWHVTYDMWHVTCDRWCGLNILSKFQLPSSYSFCEMICSRFEGQRMTLSMNDWINKLMATVFKEVIKIHLIDRIVCQVCIICL